MNRARRFLIAALIAAGMGSAPGLPAQIISKAPMAAAPGGAGPKDFPPLLLPTASPVDLFRELLAMTPADRKAFLANRTPEDQKRISAKLREYESLKPDEREVRLRVTELRWYLLPLMRAPVTNRPAQLVAVPPALRAEVQDRLGRWDLLPAALQQQLLENEAAQQYFTQPIPLTEAAKQKILDSMTPARRQKLQASIDRLARLSEEDRRKAFDSFNPFFELNARERREALATLSEAEQQQMQRTLRAFDNLPREQRSACIRSFEKFSRMSLSERQLFLKNAERWCIMSPNERARWREVVRRIPDMPPPPPGSESPPVPPGAGKPPPPRVATNDPAGRDAPAR